MAFKVTGVHWDIIIDFMELHPDLARGRINGPSGKDTFKKLWAELTLQLNATGLGERPVQKWQKTWTDFKYALKKKASGIKTDINRTGGGPAKEENLTELEIRILHLMGKTFHEGLGRAENGVFPNKVMTKQCSGYCNDNRICSAVNSTNISTSVQVVLEDGKTQCSTILVPQDTKCKCQCATTQKDCISNQKFNKKLCSCECTNISEKGHCEQKIERFNNQHFWDLKTCSCLCRRKGLCTTGTYWDKTRCRCSRQTDNG